MPNEVFAKGACDSEQGKVFSGGTCDTEAVRLASKIEGGTSPRDDSFKLFCNRRTGSVAPPPAQPPAKPGVVPITTDVMTQETPVAKNH